VHPSHGGWRRLLLVVLAAARLNMHLCKGGASHQGVYAGEAGSEGAAWSGMATTRCCVRARVLASADAGIACVLHACMLGTAQAARQWWQCTVRRRMQCWHGARLLMLPQNRRFGVHARARACVRARACATHGHPPAAPARTATSAKRALCAVPLPAAPPAQKAHAKLAQSPPLLLVAAATASPAASPDASAAQADAAQCTR